MGNKRPEVSFVLATHNRCAVVVDTLSRIADCGLARSDFEVIVVDNASTDGTPEAVAPLADRVLRMHRNGGSCAKAAGAEQATGRYLVFLDDDSHPRPHSIERMIRHFEAHDDLGAAGFAVHLPDGRQECGALPNVFVGCGVGLRAAALRAVGGLDRRFFMQAEEYDLSFRLASAGWQVRVFDDLHVEHLKTPQARRTARTTFYDIRNNLLVAARYLPRPFNYVYRRDWCQRYRWMSQRDGHLAAHRRGLAAGTLWAVRDRWAYRARRLAPAPLERFFSWDRIESKMRDLRATGAGRVIFAELGKNVFAFYRGARLAGIEVAAIGDDRLAGPNRRYRGVPVVLMDEALRSVADAVVISNTSHVHSADACARLMGQTSLPVHNWSDELRGATGSRAALPGAHESLTEQSACVVG